MASESEPNLPRHARGVALGNFDGVHRGHAELLRALAEQCARRDLVPSVLTFARHPDYVIQPERAADGYLMTSEEKAERMAFYGVAELHLMPFDQQVACQAPEQFLETSLAERLDARLIVVGEDYRFGHQGAGDVALLSRWASDRGIVVEVIPELRMAGGRISSSRIRTLVRAGDVEQAARLIGQPFSVRGTVLHGRGLGRTLGSATANFPWPAGKILPALGVYASVARTPNGVSWPAVTSVGVRPTVEAAGAAPIVETHLLDMKQPLYGTCLEVDLLSWQRPEKRFASVDQLRQAIASDIEQARVWHRRSECWNLSRRIGKVPVEVLRTDRFAQCRLLLVGHFVADPIGNSARSLLLRVLRAGCRRWPDRALIAQELDRQYGGEIELHAIRNGDLHTLQFEAEGLRTWPDGSQPFVAACTVLAELLFRPLIDEQGFFLAETVAQEQRSLLQEIESRRNDRNQYAYDRAIEYLCAGTPQAIPAEGRPDEIRALRPEDLRQAWRQLWTEANWRLYMAGPVDPELLDQVCELFAPLDVQPAETAVWLRPGICPAVFRPELSDASVEEQLQGEQDRLVLAWTGLPSYTSCRSVTTAMMNSLFGGDVHSLLFDEVREKQGMAYQIASFSRGLLQTVFVIAGVAPESAAQALEAIAGQLEVIRSDQYSEMTLARSRKLLRAGILASGDDLGVLLASRAAGVLHGYQISRQEILELADDVCRADIARLAGQMRLALRYRLTGTPREEKTHE